MHQLFLFPTAIERKYCDRTATVRQSNVRLPHVKLRYLAKPAFVLDLEFTSLLLALGIVPVEERGAQGQAHSGAEGESAGPCLGKADRGR